jgi:5,10-methylenetetrahydromethanopterin reductase
MDRFGLSIGVSPREPLRRVGELAEQIEGRGFEALWVIDFQVGMKDVHAAMLLAALHSKKLLIGPGVTNLSTRHATVTANAITALDEISDGRALLGLGAGWSAVYAAGGRPAKLAEIKEGVTQLRALFAGESALVAEREVRLATARRQIPIYLAAAQPGMLRLAGETADGVILMGAAEPEFCEWQLAFIHEGLERSGRDRSALTVDLQVTMSVNDDLDKALADVRAWATSQAATFVDWKQLPPSYERFRPEFEKASRSYHLVDHLSLHAGHKESVTDDFTRLVAIAGDERHCMERLHQLGNLDVDRITFALLSGGRERRLDQLATRIIPALA